ncbi:hypothetical protein Leryth_016445 [Lithospermum erythrorhizon]|nr:hypothetical protein Leryth_016445 [Lithospermum erythrorhizon]
MELQMMRPDGKTQVTVGKEDNNRHIRWMGYQFEVEHFLWKIQVRWTSVRRYSKAGSKEWWPGLARRCIAASLFQMLIEFLNHYPCSDTYGTGIDRIAKY